MSAKRQAAIVERMEPRLFLDASQLSETIDASTLPTVISDHMPLVGSMTVTLTNIGGLQEAFNRTQLAFLISDGTLNLSSGQYGVLKSETVFFALSPGQSRTFKLPINIPKGKLADGTDTITAAVVQAGADSQSSPGPTLTVRPPNISLSETENVLRLPGDATAGSKFSVVDRVAITNSGTDPSTDPLTIGIYASSDGIPADGTLMTSVKRMPIINPGKTVTVPVTVAAFPALAAGTYKLVTQVTQPTGTITATDPTTAPAFTLTEPTTGVQFNDSILSNTPEYMPEALNGTQESLSAITFKMSITNTGTGSSGETSFELFAATSPTFDSSAVQIGGPVTLSLGLIPHKGVRYFFLKFNTDLSQISSSSATINDYLFVQVTDPTGGVTSAGTSSTIKLAGSII